MSDHEGLSSDEMIKRAREAFTRPSMEHSFDEDEERSDTPSGDLLLPRARSATSPPAPTRQLSSRERIESAGIPDVAIPDVAIPDVAIPDLPTPRPPRPATPTRPSTPRPRRVTIPQPTDLIADAKTATDKIRRPGRGAISTLIQIVIAGVAALIVLGIFASDEGEDATPELSEEPAVPVTDLSAGTCFDDPALFGLGDIAAVACEEPHKFETIGSVVLAAGEYPGEEAGAEEAFDICLGAFESYVGSSYATSIWWMDAIPPSQSRWDGGDRVAHCYVYQLSGEEAISVTGSAASDGR